MVFITMRVRSAFKSLSIILAFTLFLVLVPQISFPKAAGDTGTTALRMVPIGPHDDIGSMWEAQIESVIYAGIDDTGNMPFVNTHIDENGYLTAACSHVAPGPSTLRVPPRYFQGEEFDLNQDILFRYDFTARASSWKMYLHFYEKGYYSGSFGIYLTKEICEKAGISIGLNDNGSSGTYQGTISIRDVINEYGAKSKLNPGQDLSTIQFCSFEIQITSDDMNTHVLQFRHLSFGYGQMTFPPAPAPGSIAIPQSKLVLPEMEEYDLCPSASSSGWRVPTKSDRGTYVPLSEADEPIATITDTADGKVKISPTPHAIQPNGCYGNVSVIYEFEEPFELDIGTDWLRFDVECSDVWLVTLNGESNGNTTSFLATSLTNYAWDWCRKSSVKNVYPYHLFANICEMWMEGFGAIHEPIIITSVTFTMSLEWTGSPYVHLTVGDLTHLKPKNDVQAVEDGISALVGRGITSADYDEVLQTKEMYDKLDTGGKASISSELRQVLKKAVAKALDERYEKIMLTGMEDGNWEVSRPLSGPGSDYPSLYIPNSEQQDVFGTQYISFQNNWNNMEAVYQPAAKGKYGPSTDLFGDISFRYNHENNPISVNFYKDKIRMNIESSLTLDIIYKFKVVLYFEGYDEGLPIQVFEANYNEFIIPANEIVDADTAHLGNGRVFIEYDLKRFLDSNAHTPDADWIARIRENGGVLNLTGIGFRQEVTYYGDYGIHMKFLDFSLLKPDETPPQPGSMNIETEEDSLSVSWTDAVDNSSGQDKLTYEVFLSTSPITEENITSLSPAKSFRGSSIKQTLLDGLTGSTTYWLALRVTDICGNSSTVFSGLVTTDAVTLNNQLSMIGVQVLPHESPGDPYSMRFGTELYCSQVGDDLKVTYNSEDYTVLDYGTIFIISDQLNAGEKLTIDIQNPKALIVPSSVIYQQTDYPSGKKSLIFTVIIKNIPASQINRSITARAYMRCRGSLGETVYFYSRPIVRSVADALGLS